MQTEDIQTRIAQKQATNIGNLMYQNSALEAERDILREELSIAEQKLRVSQDDQEQTKAKLDTALADLDKRKSPVTQVVEGEVLEAGPYEHQEV